MSDQDNSAGDLLSLRAAVERVVVEAIRDVDFVPSSVDRPHDPVTPIDRIIDERLRTALDRIVSCAYLSEESDPTTVARDGTVWIVDPVDGTHNLVAGTPEFGVSVALVDAATSTALVAVCVLPRIGETYAAAKGHGALRNGDRISVSVGADRRVLVGIGFPAEAQADVDQALGLANRLMRRGFVLRQSGSAMFDTCRVASGQLLGFVEEGIRLWDFAAADLVATEAGASSYRSAHRGSYGHPAALDYAVAGSADGLATLVGLLGDGHG